MRASHITHLYGPPAPSKVLLHFESFYLKDVFVLVDKMMTLVRLLPACVKEGMTAALYTAPYVSVLLTSPDDNRTPSPHSFAGLLRPMG